MNTPSNPFGYNGGHFYSFLNRPVLIDCNAVVDSTNPNGLGIRSLKGAGVQDIFMYTAETAGKGNSGMTNPMAHTASEGYALIKLKNNYKRYCGGFSGFVAPVTGSPIAIDLSDALLVPGTPYIIVSVGTSTLADYQAIGVPGGITPATGVSFVATATGAGVGNGTVIAAGASGITNIEVIGDPNLSLSPGPQGGTPFVGGYILVKLLASGSATKPTDGSVIGLSFYVTTSSVQIAGE